MPDNDRSIQETSGNAPSISVITCAHNSRYEYLSRTLAALQAQTLAKISWEFVVVDSFSDEPIEARIDLSWHPHARVVREQSAGLTRARLRGIAETTGDLLVFVDDDNELDSDYLDQAARIARDWPRIGAWSGCTRPQFESSPPAWTKRYWGNLVIRDVTSDLWSNLPLLPETMPCGAGLCVRRSVAFYYRQLHDKGKRSFMLDRIGQSLLSGGDNDLAASACDVGLGVGIFTSLRLTHLIPAVRLEEDYLVSLAEGISLSAILLKSFRTPRSAMRLPSLKNRLADVARAALMNRRDRRFFLATKRGERTAYRMLELQASESKSSAA
jgi:glycosyltransferase involved in cell wall biosynthesis